MCGVPGGSKLNNLNEKKKERKGSLEKEIMKRIVNLAGVSKKRATRNAEFTKSFRGQYVF